MKDSLTKEEKFRMVPDLYIQNDYIGCVSRKLNEILVADIWLTVKQARELRDWLGKVIP